MVVHVVALCIASIFPRSRRVLITDVAHFPLLVGGKNTKNAVQETLHFSQQCCTESGVWQRTEWDLIIIAEYAFFCRVAVKNPFRRLSLDVVNDVRSVPSSAVWRCQGGSECVLRDRHHTGTADSTAVAAPRCGRAAAARQLMSHSAAGWNSFRRTSDVERSRAPVDPRRGP